MKKNMGLADRLIRITIAIVLGALFFTGYLHSWWGIALVVLAVIFVVTSFVGFCPAYSIFGIHTRMSKVKKNY